MKRLPLLLVSVLLLSMVAVAQHAAFAQAWPPIQDHFCWKRRVCTGPALIGRCEPQGFFCLSGTCGVQATVARGPTTGNATSRAERPACTSHLMKSGLTVAQSANGCRTTYALAPARTSEKARLSRARSVHAIEASRACGKFPALIRSEIEWYVET